MKQETAGCLRNKLGGIWEERLRPSSKSYPTFYVQRSRRQQEATPEVQLVYECTNKWITSRQVLQRYDCDHKYQTP